jgi:hypothetical protein
MTADFNLIDYMVWKSRMRFDKKSKIMDELEKLKPNKKRWNCRKTFDHSGAKGDRKNQFHL